MTHIVTAYPFIMSTKSTLKTCYYCEQSINVLNTTEVIRLSSFSKLPPTPGSTVVIYYCHKFHLTNSQSSSRETIPIPSLPTPIPTTTIPVIPLIPTVHTLRIQHNTDPTFPPIYRHYDPHHHVTSSSTHINRQ